MRLGVGAAKFKLRFTLGMNLEERLAPAHDITNGFTQAQASYGFGLGGRPVVGSTTFSKSWMSVPCSVSR